MTQEERELVLKEICSRIYYWPTIITEDWERACGGKAPGLAALRKIVVSLQYKQTKQAL